MAGQEVNVERDAVAVKLQRAQIPSGAVTLAALVYTPREWKSDVCLTLAHGFTASKESLDVLASYLCSRGYGCVTFDFRGHKLGGSSGEIRSAEDVVEDLTAAARWGMSHFGCAESALVGHSMGALVSLVVAAREPWTAGVAAVATGPNPSAGFRQPVGMAMLSQRSDYVTGIDPMTLLEEMDVLANQVQQNPPKPTLLVAATADVIAKPSRVREMVELVGPHAEIAEVDASHLDAPDRARGTVANWLDRHFR